MNTRPGFDAISRSSSYSVNLRSISTERHFVPGRVDYQLADAYHVRVLLRESPAYGPLRAGNELGRPERKQDEIAHARRDSYLGEAAFRSERDQGELRLAAPFGEVADIGYGQRRRVDQHALRRSFGGRLEVPIVVDDRGLDAMLREEPLKAPLMACS